MLRSSVAAHLQNAEALVQVTTGSLAEYTSIVHKVVLRGRRLPKDVELCGQRGPGQAAQRKQGRRTRRSSTGYQLIHVLQRAGALSHGRRVRAVCVHLAGQHDRLGLHSALSHLGTSGSSQSTLTASN